MKISKTILFDIHQHPSHYNSALKLARLLKSDGHKILFLGGQRFKDIVCEAGFAIVNQETMSLEDARANIGSSDIQETVMKKKNYFFNDSHFKAWMSGVRGHNNLIKALKVDVVFLDEDINHRWLWYLEADLKVVVFSSKPYTGSDRVILPFTSRRIPQNTISGRLIAFLSWKVVSIRHILSNLSLEIKTLGKNYFTFSKMHAKQIGYHFNENLDIKHVFKWVFKDYNKIILMPEELEFPRGLPDNIYYVGQYADTSRIAKLKDLRYLAVIENYERSDVHNKKLIYCSLGTLTYLYLKESIKFFKRIIQVAEKLPNYTFILSIGSFLPSHELLPLPNNVFIFSKVVQAYTLKKCDLIINHGGMNSIMESIKSNVPQLIFPLSLKWDQNGNAARVHYHQLGLRGNLRKDTVPDIIKKINDIFENYDSFKGKIKTFNGVIESRYTDENVLKLLNRLMSTHMEP